MQTNITDNVRRLLDGRPVAWLAEHTGLDYFVLYRRVARVARAGRVPDWTAEQLVAVARALGVTVEQLTAEPVGAPR
jgi:hypothetical protein